MRKILLSLIGGSSRLAEVEVIKGVANAYDIGWVTNVPTDSTVRQTMEYARKYCEGELTQSPVMEVLVQGDYIFKPLG